MFFETKTFHILHHETGCNTNFLLILVLSPPRHWKEWYFYVTAMSSQASHSWVDFQLPLKSKVSWGSFLWRWEKVSLQQLSLLAVKKDIALVIVPLLWQNNPNKSNLKKEGRIYFVSQFKVQSIMAVKSKL